MSRLDETLDLVLISSVSRHESKIASFVESKLRTSEHLDVERVGGLTSLRERRVTARRE